ncbi:hypothetical protein Dimus_009895 [Dionaea muscipula]
MALNQKPNYNIMIIVVLFLLIIQLATAAAALASSMENFSTISSKLENADAGGHTATFEVQITNALQGPQQVMVMECKSDADHIALGMRVVKAGASEKWSFNPEGLRVNHFLCNFFHWNLKPVSKLAAFEVFDYKRDKDRCGKDHVCKWLVKTDGLHGLGTPPLFFPWPPAPA